MKGKAEIVHGWLERRMKENQKIRVSSLEVLWTVKGQRLFKEHKRRFEFIYMIRAKH